MATAVRELRGSEGWRRWLRARRYFHRYSFRNQLLIAMQCPEATIVAGFKAWLRLGYCVNKGEHAIWIWARCDPSKRRLERWRREGADPRREPKPFYRMVPVFDRSQVEPLPDFPGGPLELAPPPPEPIAGDGLAHLFEPLASLGAEIGYEVKIEEVAGDAEAYCDLRRRVIAVEPIGPDGAANRQIARLVHELSHALLRAERREGDPRLSRGEEEVVVECVAACVCATVGLDISGSSAPYIAGWGDGGEIERYAEMIDRLARRIEDIALTATEASERSAARSEERVAAAA